MTLASRGLAAQKERIDEQRLRLARGESTSSEYRSVVDEVVLGLAAQGGWAQPGCALVALGGYGRGEMAPRSDIDLLFLVDRRGSKERSPEPVLYALWDLGFDVGHALRTPAECGRIAKEDLTAATALLDSRLLTGDEAILADARRRAGIRPGGSRQMRRWAASIIDDVRSRRLRFGEVSNLLEPHVKEGRGGLRDFHAARWLLACIGQDPERGILSLPQGPDASIAYQFLCRVRNALHAAAGRKTDHLTFDFHQEVASLVSPDKPIEGFFRALHAAGHAIGGAWDEAVQLGQEEPTRPWSRRRGDQLTPASLALRIEEWGRAGEPLPLQARQLLRTMDRQEASKMLTSLAARSLRARTPLAPLLRELHGMGLLGTVLPEVEAVAHDVHYDARHAFTTGIHCLETLSVFEDLWFGLLEKEEPHLTRLASGLTEPHVVRLASLCHDLGKAGGAGNHIGSGAEIGRSVALRLGFSPEEAAAVGALVREHHALPSIALRSDLESPASWEAARQAAKPPASLEALSVLAFSDLRGTHPRNGSGVWSDWTRDLLLTLYARASREGAPSDDKTKTPDVPAHAGVPRRELDQVPPDLLRRLLAMAADLGERPATWEVDFRAQRFLEVLGAARTAPRLLSSVTGALLGLRLDILSFQVHRWRDGTVHLWIRAASADTPPSTRELTQRLQAAVAGELRPPKFSRPTLPNPREDAMPMRTRVALTDGTDPYHSVLEVTCLDRRGLMYDLATIFEALGLTVTYALATTEGPAARDVFHLQDIFGGKLSGGQKIDALLDRVNGLVQGHRSERGEPVRGSARPAANSDARSP